MLKRAVKRIVRPILLYTLHWISALFPIQYESYKVRTGYRIYCNLKEKYGKDCQLVFMRGATGDVFLANSLLPAYLKEKQINAYVILGDGKGLSALSKMFGVTNVVPLKRWYASCFQSFFKFAVPSKVDITDLFLWQHTMYFNRCRTRMLEQFHFMDTYQWYVFGFPKYQRRVLPRYSENNLENQNKWHNMGIIPGKTIIIVPHAYSVTSPPKSFWKELDHELHSLGWKTLYCVNPKSESSPFHGAETIWFSFADSVPLLEYAGAFLSVRNGLCDIVSSASCRMVILYPNKLETPNYSEHRSDVAFCGLRTMGLNENAIELSTPLIRNVELQSNVYSRRYTQDDISRLIYDIKYSLKK